MIFTPAGILEIFLTLGVSIVFFGLLISAFFGRREITSELRQFRLNKKHIIVAVLIVFLFLAIEFYVVQPTQMLYFDDDIYQAGALDLLHTGQAWQCNYGTPTNCFIGLTFLEPVGESFNLAIGFLFFGVKEYIAYGTQITIAAIAVFMSFFAALLLLRNVRGAFFTELLMALSPAVLMWARPTTSDLPAMVYSIILVFFFMLFMRRKNAKTFAMLAFSAALVAYMKVDEMALFAVLVVGYVILEYKSIAKTISESSRLINSALLNSKVLSVLMLFVIAMLPEIIYVVSQSSAGSYVYVGSQLPNTCGTNPAYTTATSTLSLGYFSYNLCANLLFWLGTYNSQYVVQPIEFTVLALLGGVLMFFSQKRKELLFIAIWFFVFFFIYTIFYAGSALFGINWRFQLDMIPPMSILGGYCCAFFIDKAGDAKKRLAKKRNTLGYARAVIPFAYLVFLAAIFYSIVVLLPYVGVSVSNLPQAGNARFYENFVLNQSSVIPSNCAVFSYDPTLFFLVNRSSLQMFYLYNSTIYNNVSQRFSCKVLDYGYWCYTPNNICPSLTGNEFALKPILTSTYIPLNQTFGFYYINMTNNST